MKNIFDQNDVDELIGRINQLTPSTTPQWGKMNVAQMLVHCNVTINMSGLAENERLFFKNRIRDQYQRA